MSSMMPCKVFMHSLFYSCVIVSRYWFWFNGYNILICFMYASECYHY
jgi:hypothetical protein